MYQTAAITWDSIEDSRCAHLVDCWKKEIMMHKVGSDSTAAFSGGTTVLVEKLAEDQDFMKRQVGQYLA